VQKASPFQNGDCPYGGGKTHFLMSLGSRALKEGYAVAYIACTQGIDLNNSFDLYKAFIRCIQLPVEQRPGRINFSVASSSTK